MGDGRKKIGRKWSIRLGLTGLISLVMASSKFLKSDTILIPTKELHFAILPRQRQLCLWRWGLPLVDYYTFQKQLKLVGGRINWWPPHVVYGHRAWLRRLSESYGQQLNFKWHSPHFEDTLASFPQIDIGQVEGAFVQGAGMFTTEDLIWGDGEHQWLPKGCLATRGPGFYKIPAPNDVPLDFNVHLLKVWQWLLLLVFDTFLWYNFVTFACARMRATHERFTPQRQSVNLRTSSVPQHSSQSRYLLLFWSQERLLIFHQLSYFLYLVFQDALRAVRQDNGKSSHFTLHSPATSERIRMAALDELATPFAKLGDPNSNPETYQPAKSLWRFHNQNVFQNNYTGNHAPRRSFVTFTCTWLNSSKMTYSAWIDWIE